MCGRTGRAACRGKTVNGIGLIRNIRCHRVKYQLGISVSHRRERETSGIRSGRVRLPQKYDAAVVPLLLQRQLLMITRR